MLVQNIVYRRTLGPGLDEREGPYGIKTSSYCCDLCVSGLTGSGFVLAPSIFSNTYDEDMSVSDAKVNIGYPCFVNIYDSFFDVEVINMGEASAWDSVNFTMAFFVGNNTANVWPVGTLCVWCYDHCCLLNGGKSCKFRVKIPDISKIFLPRGSAIQIMVDFGGLTGGAGVNVNWHVPYNIYSENIG